MPLVGCLPALMHVGVQIRAWFCLLVCHAQIKCCATSQSAAVPWMAGFRSANAHASRKRMHANALLRLGPTSGRSKGTVQFTPATANS